LMLQNSCEIEKAREDLSRWSNTGVRFAALGTSEYPQILATIYDPPPIIFYRSETKLPFEHLCIAIVGSRKTDNEGTHLCKDIAKELSSLQITVVSGLAYGIDAAAHWGALSGKGSLPTIAVLGSGLYNLYPAANAPLADEIIKNGGIILSEFEPDASPFPANFLRRNRVISGLSLGTVVIRAAKRSGSLATARFAMEQGREVMAVPGSPINPISRGTNELIRQGATLINCARDILEQVEILRQDESAAKDDINAKKLVNEIKNLSEDEKIIIKKLQAKGSLYMKELLPELENFARINTALTMLEQQKFISIAPGNQVFLSRSYNFSPG